MRISRSSICVLTLFVFCVATPVSNAAELDWNSVPYLGKATPTSQSVSWVSKAGGSGYVKYDRNPDDFKEIVYADANGSIFHAELTGLRANTKYYYVCESDGYKSEVHSFTTWRTDGPVSFVAMGDTRSQRDRHEQVVEVIRSFAPYDFVINSGDMVSRGSDPAGWKDFFEITAPVISEAPYFMVAGNHEGDADLYWDLIDMPKGEDSERYYSFDRSNAHFVVIDSNDTWPLNAAQREWMKRDIESHVEADWKFVSFHHPPFGTNPGRRMGGLQMRLVLHRWMRDLGVDMVINGHDHHYVHALADGVHYILTGGGGAPLYELGEPDRYTVTQARVYHACKIEIDGLVLKMKAIDIDGNEIDSLTIDKSEGAGEAAPGESNNEDFALPAPREDKAARKFIGPEAR
ncbi:MAG: metallophosphoesterase family protein [Planctomycetes bacterium]|nr:metallophosphoesterase family protein [Planctomycetota bacterium]